MASQTRALFWKEWREQRSIVITGWIVSLCLPLFIFAGAALMQRPTSGKALADTMPLFLAVLVWPLLAVACGATTISGEIGGGTLIFLLSRPASRLKVWTVKVLAGAGALATIVLGSVVITAVFQWLVGADSPRRVLDSLLYDPDLGRLMLISVWGAVILLYATGVFFSTFLSRPLTAAAAGLVVSLAIVSSLFIFWTRLELIPLFEPELVAIDLAAVGALILAGSLFVFTRGELLSGRAAVRVVMFGALAVLLGGAAISVPLFYAQTRLLPSQAVLLDIQLVRGTNSVVAAVSRERGGAFQAWQIYLDGSGYRPLTGRMALHPTVSPDGRWMVYVSQRGSFGLRSSRSSIHLQSLTGAEHRVLSASIPAGAWTVEQFHFSPRGDRIAYIVGSQLVVASTDGSGEVRHSLAPDENEWSWVVIRGWNEKGSELILEPRGSRAGTLLLAYDPQADRRRVLFETDRGSAYLWGGSIESPAGLRHVPMSLFDVEAPPAERTFELVLIATDDGRAEPIVRADCIVGLAFDDEQQRLAYAVCDPDDPERTAIELITLENGKRERLATVEGRPWPLVLSPSAEWIAVHRWGDDPRTLTIRRDGQIVEMEPGWQPAGWWGRDQVLLSAGEGGVPRVIGMGDATSGTVRRAFPL